MYHVTESLAQVDYEFATALINAAAESGVEQFVLVTSLGTGKIGFPAAILNLFGGVLIWKRETEKVLENSGMAYTIVRPGGPMNRLPGLLVGPRRGYMERLTQFTALPSTRTATHSAVCTAHAGPTAAETRTQCW